MMDINEHLAINVMGWEATNTRYKPVGSTPQDHHIFISISDWNPTGNIEQAFMCLEKFENWEIIHNFERYEVMYRVGINRPDFSAVFGAHEVVSTAISLACAKATGWNDG